MPLFLSRRGRLLAILGGGWLELAVLAEGSPLPDAPRDRGLAATVYAARLTDGSWDETLSLDAGFEDAYVLVGALSRRLWISRSRRWTWEAEGQIAKHLGKQDHWEFNALAVTRRRFPRSRGVASSAAIGVGPSYAGRDPPLERARSGDTRNLLAYWLLEWTMGPPARGWQVSFRLHHRSPAFGLFGTRGGANALAMGVRYEF